MSSVPCLQCLVARLPCELPPDDGFISCINCRDYGLQCTASTVVHPDHAPQAIQVHPDVQLPLDGHALKPGHAQSAQPAPDYTLQSAYRLPLASGDINQLPLQSYGQQILPPVAQFNAPGLRGQMLEVASTAYDHLNHGLQTLAQLRTLLQLAPGHHEPPQSGSGLPGHNVPHIQAALPYSHHATINDNPHASAPSPGPALAPSHPTADGTWAYQPHECGAIEDWANYRTN
ncbi:hypothetical protein ACEPAI_9786 [Sanghuangporus weigelae]